MELERITHRDFDSSECWEQHVENDVQLSKICELKYKNAHDMLTGSKTLLDSHHYSSSWATQAHPYTKCIP